MDSRERTIISDTVTEESRSVKHDARPTDSADTSRKEKEYEYIVRRLTPTECARLQGFPDDWCADVPHSDAAEYKLWGNGIALPCVIPLMFKAKEILLRDRNAR